MTNKYVHFFPKKKIQALGLFLPFLLGTSWQLAATAKMIIVIISKSLISYYFSK